jgi:hypothetical protein
MKNGFDEGGFPRSIGPNEANKFTLLDGEVDVFKGRFIPITFC